MKKIHLIPSLLLLSFVITSQALQIANSRHQTSQGLHQYENQPSTSQYAKNQNQPQTQSEDNQSEKFVDSDKNVDQQPQSQNNRSSILIIKDKQNNSNDDKKEEDQENGEESDNSEQDSMTQEEKQAGWTEEDEKDFEEWVAQLQPVTLPELEEQFNKEIQEEKERRIEAKRQRKND